MNRALFALAFSSAAISLRPRQRRRHDQRRRSGRRGRYTFFSFAGVALSIGTASGPVATPLADPMISACVTDNGSQLGALTATLIGTDDDSGRRC